jgi:hypothetical protein
VEVVILPHGSGNLFLAGLATDWCFYTPFCGLRSIAAIARRVAESKWNTLVDSIVWCTFFLEPFHHLVGME